MNIDKISELSAGTLRKLMEREDTKRLISDKITKDTISTLAGKLSGDQLEILDGLIQAKKQTIIQETAETQARGFEPLTTRFDRLLELLERGAGAAGGQGGQPPPGQPPLAPPPPAVVPPPGAEGLTQTEIEERERAREALEEERRRNIEERGQQ